MFRVRSIFPQNTRNTQKFLQGVQQSLLHRPSSMFSHGLHGFTQMFMVRSILPQNTRNTQKFLQGVQQSLLHRPKYQC